MLLLLVLLLQVQALTSNDLHKGRSLATHGWHFASLMWWPSRYRSKDPQSRTA